MGTLRAAAIIERARAAPFKGSRSNGRRGGGGAGGPGVEVGGRRIDSEASALKRVG
jgi:hypothetical protein